MHERLSPLASKIAVAHPGRLRLIYQSTKKSNRVDARKLASLMHLNQVPLVHVPRQEVRSWRGLIEHRRSLVDQIVGIKNQIRALLRCQGIKGLPGKRMWSKVGLAWLPPWIAATANAFSRPSWESARHTEITCPPYTRRLPKSLLASKWTRAGFW